MISRDSDVTEDKYAEYGFDKPAYMFQFTQATGEVTTPCWCRISIR